MTGPEPVTSRRVAPDPALASAVGRHHTLATAVADLVDNSLDAGARHVLIRFRLDRGRASGLQVIDDGAGMDAAALDAAMTYARRREYGATDLGHFGIGLKAASLSQARTLVVWSRRAGRVAVGRRLRRETLQDTPLVEEYRAADAVAALDGAGAGFGLESGTVVEWHDVDAFLSSGDPVEQTMWLEDTIDEIATHLGLVLHRILGRGDARIVVEQYEDGFGGAPRPVAPVDPFGYAGSVAGFPVDLRAAVPGGEVAARAHLWPHVERQSAAFHVGGRDGHGLYVYRHDRLLQAGGWNGLAHGSDLDLARIAVDLDDTAARHVTINPEKTGVVLDETLRGALGRARSDDGTTFGDVVNRARDVARDARRRRGKPIAVVRPRFGVPRQVRDVYDDVTEGVVGEEPFDMRWRNLPPDQFYEIDRDERVIKLNARYRRAVVAPPGPGRRASFAHVPSRNDAPLLKTLLHLLLADHLNSTKNGARMKKQTAAWQELLVAAARAQLDDTDGTEPA